MEIQVKDFNEAVAELQVCLFDNWRCKNGKYTATWQDRSMTLIKNVPSGDPIHVTVEGVSRGNRLLANKVSLKEAISLDHSFPDVSKEMSIGP